MHLTSVLSVIYGLGCRFDTPFWRHAASRTGRSSRFRTDRPEYSPHKSEYGGADTRSADQPVAPPPTRGHELYSKTLLTGGCRARTLSLSNNQPMKDQVDGPSPSANTRICGGACDRDDLGHVLAGHALCSVGQLHGRRYSNPASHP